jgi:hypothetical protein
MAAARDRFDIRHVAGYSQRFAEGGAEDVDYLDYH